MAFAFAKHTGILDMNGLSQEQFISMTLSFQMKWFQYGFDGTFHTEHFSTKISKINDIVKLFISTMSLLLS